MPQWVSELKTFLRPFLFDIYIYDGSLNGETFWGAEGPFQRSKHAPHHCILVASQAVSPHIHSYSCLSAECPFVLKALFREFNNNYGPLKKKARPWDFPSPKKNAALENMLMGHNYLVTVVDEAHLVRNAGRQQCAVLKLLERSVVRIPMTATPLHTTSKVSPTDATCPREHLIVLSRTSRQCYASLG